MTRRPLIVVPDGGTFYHHTSLTDPRIAPLVSRTPDLRTLSAQDLAGTDTVVVPCRANPEILRAKAPLFLSVLNRGDRLVVMGETESHLWLPGLRFTPLETNFWWWLEPEAASGLTLAAPDHPLFTDMRLEDATWHYHGMFTPPEGAASLVTCREGGAILYEDRVSWPGPLLVTSLDPMYHHGSYFMPAASRFLLGLMDWLSRPMPTAPARPPHGPMIDRYEAASTPSSRSTTT
ncbi:MAG: hypothetical protein K9H25_13870 [Rhodospirillum sp.]|nr:hypothetical protein [Rhodospirillum sp.]MCF8490114.1 hypothetical protein [Rhodospirillum sp.]MCF8501132.1 hypothetical protein [Rhodospirillum sp.]